MATLSLTQRLPDTAQRMTAAANRFLESLSDSQRQEASFPFEGDERYEWNYTPVDRNGLLIRDMAPEQREAAMSLLASGLSEKGAATAREVIELETILAEAEAMDGSGGRWERSRDLYWFSVFGQPGQDAPWGWRAGGHHIGVHLTVVDKDFVSATPLFFGANPAEVQHGDEKGKRVLAEEEDMARTLLSSLDDGQKSIAVMSHEAPGDILTRNYREADAHSIPRGLAFSIMNSEQQSQLVRLIRHYIDRAAPDVARSEWEKIDAIGLNPVTFSWAGPEERGHGHYYAVRGLTFLMEYDNTQDNANHVHSVWRDFTNDWGEDLLAAHYKTAHRA